ncbi:MAG TPA: hypothetical protein VF647_20475 [Longimicrobium sp.]|jgi:TPP-dependent pyruvate/acetoin dehydrogenase alpha subunit
MVSIGKSKREERTRAARYHEIGQALLQTAGDLDALADPRYGNALAIIAIHAAIAFTDALTVKYRELKSTDGDHTRAADLLVHAMGHRADADQVRRLRGILSAKSSASYSGNFYTLADGVRVLTETRIYAQWSAEMLQERL